MSFIASASDSLISPVNAVNGQTLTWNAITGQFEPTTSPSGDTPELLLWAANTAYLSGDTVSANLISSVILRKAGAGTSSATLDATELAAWRYFGQNNYPAFLASSLVCTNFVISQGGQLWQSISNRVTGATFDATEQTNWVALTSAGTTLPALTDLRGLRGDGTGIPVADARLQYGTANASTIDFNLNGSAGIRLSSVGGNNLITNAGTPNGSSLTIRTQDSVAGLNNFPGNLNLSTGSGTGNGVADIVFSTCLPTVSGTTVTNPVAAWTMGQDAFAATLTANRVGGGGIIQAASNEQLNVRTLGTGSLALSPIGSGILTIGAAGTGAIGIGTGTKTTTISGIVKKPTMAFLRTSATASTTVAANTNTIIAFPAATTNGTGISVAASTFTVARTGFYSIKLKVSFQSATTNVRGLVFLAGTAIFAGTTPQKAFRTPANANANAEIEAAWDVQVTSPGNFTVQISATAAGTVNLNSGATATAATTEITILEIG